MSDKVVLLESDHVRHMANKIRAMAAHCMDTAAFWGLAYIATGVDRSEPVSVCRFEGWLLETCARVLDEYANKLGAGEIEDVPVFSEDEAG